MYQKDRQLLNMAVLFLLFYFYFYLFIYLLIFIYLFVYLFIYLFWNFAAQCKPLVLKQTERPEQTVYTQIRHRRTHLVG